MRVVDTTEATLTATDGRVLYTKTWEPAEGAAAARARLVWLHGFGDHCNSFGAFFSALARRGIAVHAFDQRGWGRSVTGPSDRGAPGSTATVLSDVTDFVGALARRAGPPLFLGGHSMGGGDVLLWAARAPAEARRPVRGYVAEAPLMRLHAAVAPPAALVWLARLAARVCPNVQFRHGPPPDDGQAADPLAHNAATLRGTVDIMDRGEALASGRFDLHETDEDGDGVGLWLALGDDDELVCLDAVRDYFARSGIRDKQLRTYQWHGHELHRETEEAGAVFTEDLILWISERADACPSSKESSQ